ncbi:MAG: hypothetical protein U5K69_01310 [Balneolaceae bacterium]|nr:hypothetical protein [Balneolaceae bacterium]
MQTAPGAGLPAENLGVLRVRRRVMNPYSYVGAMTTSRLGRDGSYNVAYGLDGTLRLFGDDYLAFAWAQTFDDDQETGSIFDAAQFRAHWERRTQVGLGYDLSLTQAGAAYTPGLGFQLRRDYTRLGDRLFYGWMPGEGSRLFQHEVSLYGRVFLRNAGGTVESAAVGPGWSGQTRIGADFDVRLLRRTERLQEAFALAEGVSVPAGDYAFYQVEGTYGTTSSRRWSATAETVAGSFYDGRRFALGVVPAWSLSRYLDLSGAYRFERVAFPERDRRFNVHVARLRVEASLNTELSGAAFIQYNSAGDAVIANVRLRYNPREGNDLYLVYNHGLNTDRHRRMPTLPITGRQTVLVKYTHTLNFGI